MGVPRRAWLGDILRTCFGFEPAAAGKLWHITQIAMGTVVVHYDADWGGSAGGLGAAAGAGAAGAWAAGSIGVVGRAGLKRLSTSLAKAL